MKLSFCITCKNRFDQINQTLKINLRHNKNLESEIEFVLIDFGSHDGLQDWVVNNFSKELKTGFLKYYYTGEMPKWDCSIAKNTAHLYAKGEIVVNLDCDNFTGEQGGKFVIEHFNVHGDKLIFHQASSNPRDGSFGRIAVMRKYFSAIGGYDESFHPMGFQDADLIRRLHFSGLYYVSNVNSNHNQAIPNSKEESIKFTGSDKGYFEMNDLNRQLSRNNINQGRFIANNGVFGLKKKISRWINNGLEDTSFQ
jgi:glycosyltransferase involved in cell wall biosynthesis